MRMERAIIESIAEVELEITPEFKKPEKHVSISDLASLLKERGWVRIEADHLESVDIGPGKSTLMTVQGWTYGETPGLKLVVRRHTQWVGSNPVPEQQVEEVVVWSAAWGESKIDPPTEEAIEARLNVLQMKYHMGSWAEKPDLPSGTMEDLEKAMGNVGWALVSSAGPSKVAYEYEYSELPNAVVVEGDEQGNVVRAWAAYGTETSVPIQPPTIDNIVAKATELETSGTAEKVDEFDPRVLDKAMAKIGWKVMASSASAVVFKKKGVDDSIVVGEGMGKILWAQVHYGDGSEGDIYPPAIGNIVEKAKLLSGAAH